MPTCKDQARAIAVGDTAKVKFNHPQLGTYAIEGVAAQDTRTSSPSVRIGSEWLTDSGVVNPRVVEVVSHTPKAKPFFTNQPVERKPQSGDVISAGIGGLWYHLQGYVYSIGATSPNSMTIAKFTAKYRSVSLRSEGIK